MPTSSLFTTMHAVIAPLMLCLTLCKTTGMFHRLPWLDNFYQHEHLQRNYGVAVADVDFDGRMEWIVAGFTGPNYILKFNYVTNSLENIVKSTRSMHALLDPEGKAIGVCACDIDGDGKEELYFLNTNNAYAGKSSYGDKLFKYRNGRYVNLFEDDVNKNVEAKNYAGRSVSCVDRFGSGKYGIAVATYSDSGTGKFALLEMDENDPRNDISTGTIVIRNVASDARVERSTGGRGIVVGPILSDQGKSDIFFVNEGNSYLKNKGHNYMFKNLGNGSFVDVALESGLADKGENGRGVAIADFNRDGLFDIVYGNWIGHHRLYLQERQNGKTRFRNFASEDMQNPSKIRTVIVADFDNDANLEIFFNNIYSRSEIQPNRLFKVRPVRDNDPEIFPLNPGDALEEDGCGTGGAVADIDGDGQLDLLLSHGEDGAQPLSVFAVNRKDDNNWIRIFPKTKFGAPARGATVAIESDTGMKQLSVIDGGSGYLCQMEPVAHFGLGEGFATKVRVTWPDGRTFTKKMNDGESNQVHVIMHPDYVTDTVTFDHSPDKKPLNVTIFTGKPREEL